MELVERAGFLASLEEKFDAVATGEGHCVLVSGEAGIGKTSLVKAFCNAEKGKCRIVRGSCDALFTPRPLAPLYDIALQMQGDLLKDWDTSDRTVLFSRWFHKLSDDREPTIIIFEDIHWADEATLDLIKFMARRISLTKCLFILTYRDNEIHSRHPLRSVLGQLPPDSFSRLQLLPLSRQAVDAMATTKGYRGEDVYTISGGIPFYVNEILASYSPGIPDNIKNSIIAIYNRHVDNTRRVWTILSVLPAGINPNYLEKMEPGYDTAIEDCLGSGILVVEYENIHFKHELYRRTIEASLSPLKRVVLNREILYLFKNDFEQNGEIERIVHHAKNANDYDTVVQYAPIAAKAAAQVGAHIEAAKLYYTAIEYYQGSDKDKLLWLYEAYAYECYLTNQIKDAIIYQGKALEIYKERGDMLKTGDCMRFLSRLWWFDGNRKQADLYGDQAVEVLRDQPSSRAKAMAFSNMSQLKMLSNEPEACIYWGERAIAIAKEIGDEEVRCHALNNIGAVQVPYSAQKGIGLLQESLNIALEHAYHEHAARAYTNLGSTCTTTRNFDFAEKAMDEGIAYCKRLDLGSWADYMSSQLAKTYLETGRWNEAFSLASQLLENELQTPIIKVTALMVIGVVKLRKGEPGALPLLLEAKTMAFRAAEVQRIGPVVEALLEYEWLTATEVIEKDALDETVEMTCAKATLAEINDMAYWLKKVRGLNIPLPEILEGYDSGTVKQAQKAAAWWEKLNCPYMKVLALFEGNEDNKREAIAIAQELGAMAVYEKLKLEMRASGIKSIPRGKRESTMTNAAHLTGRELDVLQLLKEGLKNKEIADKLFISAKTVDHHISAILVKLDVDSRARAVNEATRIGILK